MKIQNNITAMNANRILGVNKSKTAKTLEKLASGYRINRSADDAAGLAVSEKMRSMINGITQAEKNCHDAVSLVQTAEGALNEVHSMLQRMNELANQAANGSYDDGVDRASLQLEFTQIQDEIDHIAEHTDFNGMNLFDGTGGTYKLPSGNTVTKQQKYTAVDASAQQNNVTLESVLSQKSEKLQNIIYTETTFNFETTQTQTGSATSTSGTGWAEAAETLETQIVPQAVQAIMSKYTAFNYLTGSSIGIGLNLYSDSSTTLAYVSASPTAYQNNTTGEVYATAMTYTLSVNMNSVDLSTEEGRSALESTIAHEMIHAFMFEATTAGMFGLSSSGQTDSFPAWFAEGMAQTASGPGNWVHHGMGITPDSDTSEISTALANDPLTSSESNTTAQYGTGYLACMYLGYLASGADANLSSSTAAASDILSGLNTMLSKIISGSSLDSVINEISGGKYSSTSDFENGFANDGDVVSFIQIMALQGYFSTDSTPNDGYTSNVVSGGLISGDLLNGDPYSNASLSLNLFALDSTNTAVKNEYPSDITVLSGGVVSADGVAPTEDMTPSVTSTGDFTVTGGTYGTDYTYDEDTGTLTVLTGTALTIEGTGNATTDKIKIADGTTANVTIKNVNIDVSGTSDACAFEVGENSTVNLTLEGENTLKSGAYRAGLQVGEGEKLVIDGSGSLDATGGGLAAGIGGVDCKASGTIEINGGEVTATGGEMAAGIGGGYCGSGGNIVISGGTVKAIGGEDAVAIGDGYNGSGGTFSTGENGTAVINVSNADGDTEIADLISDTSGIDVWSAKINGTQYPIAPSTGSFTVTGGTYGTDYTYDESTGTLTVLTDKAITIEGTGTATTDKIKIADNITANVTIKNVNIDVRSTGGVAFEVGENSTVNLTLEGKNTLKSEYAGLQVQDGETLVITANSTGSLDATGGRGAAGIGGSIYDSGGTIEINGGTVTAKGGSSAAGIGGGRNGSSENIYINGGIVTATGGSYAAGIGGGYNGSGGIIDISGGEVTATGGSNAVAIGDGANGSGGTFSTGTNGTAVINVSNTDGDTEIADLISDTSGKDAGIWSATINGTIYGLPTPSAPSTGSFTVTGGTYGTDYTYDEDTGTLTVLTDEAITIEGTGNATTDKIKINDGITANVTIKNVNIDLSGTSSVCAFEVGENSTVNLTLEGTNILKSGAHRAGLQVGEGETLIINGDGSLDVTGGTAAAGIGGNNFRLYEADYGSNATSGTIIIDGGIITATGVRAAGIGGGYGGSGGNTTITGGKVSATGSRGGAGIGGGCGTSTSGGSGGNIEISGGKVTATGGENAVAIGDGVNGSGSTFSTTENGNAEITVSNADNDTEIADLISDTSGIDVWSATINGVQYPIAAPAPSTGSFTVTGGTYGTDYTYDADIGTLTVLTDRAITIEGTGSATTDKIKINDGTNANVTIKNVNIDVSSAGGTAAFEVGEGSTVNLTLEGTNILKSGAHRAGLQVGEGETLVIDGNGSLDATGGEAGAGIGGSIYDSGGTIEINGGEVTATGGSSGAGIGGGPNGSGGTIEINGGTVTATGGTDGAGIGGGNDGGGGTVDINGGTVTATGGEWAAGIGGGGGAGGNTGGTINIDGGTVSATGGQGGAGIGGGNNAAGGDVTISGGNVTATGGTATSGNSPEAIGAGGENGSGGTFSTTENGTAVITANVKDADDNIISDPTIEQLISDTSGIDVWSATINGVQYPIAAPAPSTGDFTVTGGTYGTDYTYDEDTGTLTVLTNEAIKIEGTGSATTDKIKIDDGITANVTIKNVNIDVSDTDYACAFEVGENSTVNLTLEGENTLKSGYDCAGLQVGEGEKLVIDGSGSLDATGGEFGAGIGGSDHDSGGTIEIKSGEVTATAGNYAAGIGGGYEGSGGDIDINGGTVTATGGAYAAGIGGGDSGSSGGNIDISGGTVTATGGFEGSGIGGGVGGDGGNIVIGGGNVTATGGDWAAGIGGGNTGDGGKIEISGGTVNATGGEDAVAIGDGKNGSGGTFSTGTNGVAVITANVKDINDDIISDLTIEQLISDTSGIDTWKATINGTQYPIQLQGNGQINLNDVDGPVTITDNGYTIGDKTYVYTGDYTFTGTTDEDITVSSGGTTNITFDGVTGENFTVKGNSTVNLTVTNTSTVDNVTVENGSKLNIVSGTLNVTNKLDNDGTVENSGVLNNSGEIDNDGDITNNSGGKITNANGGTIDNSGDITNNSGGTIVNIIGSDITNNNSGSINNDGLISSSGTISNSGDITNNSGGAIDSAGDINNNSSGAVNNDGEIYNGGTINNSGAVNNDGEIINANGGTIDNSGDITNNNGGTITNNGTGSISNSGDITNNSGGTVENAGNVTNNNGGTVTNSGTLTNTDSGSISNSGDITNKSGGTVENAGSVTNNNGGTIDNSGTITNSGEITNADGGTIDNSGDIDSTGGTLTNNGEIKSRPDSNIDGTVGGANQPVDAPAKADDDDDKDGDFEDGENIWIMQVGGRSKDTFAMDIGRMNTKILGVDKDSVNISTQASANAAIDKIGEAVNKLSRQRADIGAYQNRLEHKIDNLNVTRENLISAESKIRDTDMAVYMMEFTKNQILNNAAQAMLAQANSLPQSVLSLIQ
ncbi:MAG: hypothetical protein IJN43_01250 [Ruminococcus sp.]|nr:hypothetical protein [Ruminococcus sp.]